MNKHTFKVGDRVIYTDSSSKTHAGAKGQYWEGTHDGGTRVLSGVKFDNDCLNRSVCNREFFSVFPHASLRHDTDFEVGDWVRYEGVHPRVVSPLLEGKVGKIEYLDGDSCAGIPQFHMQSGGVVYKENLVKIQPPQEESDNTIVHVFTSYTNEEQKKMRNVFSITHEKYGVVQGVHQVSPGCYCKNGANYYHGEGWREFEEWVKIEVNKKDWDLLHKSTHHSGLRMFEGVRYRYTK